MCVFVSKEKRKKVKLDVLLTVIKFDVHPNIIYFLHCNSHIHTRTLIHAWPAHILQLNLSFAFDNYPLMHGSCSIYSHCGLYSYMCLFPYKVAITLSHLKTRKSIPSFPSSSSSQYPLSRNGESNT